jgi:DNA mismatch endonuclease, patch repair protein
MCNKIRHGNVGYCCFASPRIVRSRYSINCVLSDFMDTRSKQVRIENMRRIVSKNTNPELAVRHLLFSLDYRYRLHRSDLPGQPDIVFQARKKAIFVHGCFWHQHAKCRRTHTPKSNLHYWPRKLARNKERDRANRRTLARMGWSVLVIWECEIRNLDKLKSTLTRFLGPAVRRKTP